MIVAILIIFSVYVALFIEPDESNDNLNSDDNGDENNNENDSEGDDNETDYQEFIHTVLIEEGTRVKCTACPKAADNLYDLYTSGNYNFYYVAMIQDKNTKAKNRLINDYNIQAHPTIFFDGGFRVVNGNSKSKFEEALSEAESRIVPELRIIVTSEYDNKTNKIDTSISVENNETEKYTGVLKVYLTEIISHINNNDNEPYHFGFIDYIENKEISIDAKANYSISVDPYDISNFDAENLMVIASIFSSESVEKLSYPGDNRGEFDAYYTDATNATKIVKGGNLPPYVGISLPKSRRLHLLGRPIFDMEFKNTILIGKTKIIADVEDDSGIEKVEFYINGKLKNTDTQEPYEYSFRKVRLLKRFVRRYTITVKAYDIDGKNSTTDIKVIGFFL